MQTLKTLVVVHLSHVYFHVSMVHDRFYVQNVGHNINCNNTRSGTTLTFLYKWYVSHTSVPAGQNVSKYLRKLAWSKNEQSPKSVSQEPPGFKWHFHELNSK